MFSTGILTFSNRQGARPHDPAGRRPTGRSRVPL